MSYTSLLFGHSRSNHLATLISVNYYIRSY